MATPFRVELITPERVLFSGESEEVSLRTDGGEIAFLAGHEDYIAAVDITVVRLGAVPEASDAAGEVVAAVHGGFVHVDDDGVRILASVAELAGEIDVERARAALATNQERLASEGPAVLPTAGGDESEESETAVALSGAMVALLAPASAEAGVRRARVRLEAAGVAPAAN